MEVDAEWAVEQVKDAKDSVLVAWAENQPPVRAETVFVRNAATKNRINVGYLALNKSVRSVARLWRGNK